MANLTRILNNQIFNSTIIASQKIAAGTITGSLFSSNVTVPGDLLISGNLFVLGTSAYTTIASTNTFVNDPLITLNNGFAGTNTYDEGLIFNRGTLQNRAIIWSEYFQEFRLIGTTEVGTTYGNVVTSNFANLHIGNLIVDYTITHNGDFITTGFINTTGNISAAVGLFGAINSTGLINTTGNVSASQVSVATLNATGLINTLGNISASEGSFATINATGLINTAGNVLGAAATFSSSQINGNQSVTGNLNVTGNILGSAGTLSSLDLNSATNATDATGTTGALQVAGGVSIAKDLYVGGNLYAANIIGITANVITVEDPLVFFKPSYTSPYNYDIGFYSAFTGTGLTTAGNVLQHTAIVRNDSDNTWTFASNLAEPGAGHVVFNADTVYDPIKAGNLTLVNTTASTTTGTGALIVAGGAGIAGAVTAGSFNTAGNLSAAGVDTGALNATGTTTLVAVNSTGFINTTANISASRINADTLAATGTIWANAATDTSSLTTGALIVAGGTAIGKTLWVGEGAVINSTRAAEAFQVYGATGNDGLIYADTAKSAIVFSSTGNTTVHNGVIAKFDSTGAVILPVGSSAQRPGSSGNVDVIGMIRFSETVNNLEFYDGDGWQTAGTSFTVITDRQFSGNVGGGFGNVDGTNTTFTLQANSTTAGTLVSINGVLQFPTLAYSVTNNQLEFTEPPAPNDVIDARIFTTTTELTSLVSSSGYNQFVAADTGAQIWSGVSAPTQRIEVNTAGDINLLNGTDIVYTQTAVNITANNTPYVIATRSQTTFTSATFQVSAKRGTGATGNVESYTAQVVTDGDGNAYISTYGITNNGYSMGVLTANVIAGNVNVYYTGTVAASVVQANVKAFGTYIV
jgi:hypothetical protein